jgi:hypothetical protein
MNLKDGEYFRLGTVQRLLIGFYNWGGLFTKWHELSLCNSGLFASLKGIFLTCVLYDARRNTPRNTLCMVRGWIK